MVIFFRNHIAEVTGIINKISNNTITNINELLVELKKSSSSGMMAHWPEELCLLKKIIKQS
jgi:hypothetical protein